MAALGAVAVPAITLDLTGSSTSTGDWWDRLFLSLKNGGYAEWTELVGSTFKLTGRTGGAELTLVEVRPFNSRSPRPESLARDRAFAAFFQPTGAAPADDRTYTASHAKYGSLDIFMSPGAPAGRTHRMIAIFN